MHKTVAEIEDTGLRQSILKGEFPMSLDLSAQTVDPIMMWRSAGSPRWKRILALLIRPALDWRFRRYLSKGFLLNLPPAQWVLPDRGFSLQALRAWINRRCPLKGSRILIQGTGSGWDALTWLTYCPEKLCGVDFFPFASSWDKVRSHARTSGLAVPEFTVSTLENLPFKTGSFDLAVSDAVFEHCRDLEHVLLEAHRVLRPGGFLYATYGPMWYCFGGDHFSGRGGLTYGYSHIELRDREYQEYFQSKKTANEDAQSGGRYVEVDLFSKLHTREYISLYRKCGFKIIDLILQVSLEALRFKNKYPHRFQEMLKTHPDLEMEDLLIKGNFVILQAL